MSRLSKLIGFIILAGLLGGCTQGLAPDSPPSQSSSMTTAVRVVRAAEISESGALSEDDPITGLQFTLTQGLEQPEVSAPITQPVTTPLTAEEVDDLLGRLPSLPMAPGDAQDLALPPTTIPPPRTGVTVQEPFPPPATPPPAALPENAPLEVLRYSPEGAVPLAANLSVTFNQPMVALTGLQALSEAPPPVQLSPLPPGQWRWVGTSTLLFEPDPRFPMATRYTVEVPAGTKSATGATLADAVSWTFTTPPPQVLQFSPTGSGLPLDPLMVATFDQKIDPVAVLAAITVKANGVTAPTRLATAAELDGDKAASALIENAGEDRWIAFRAREPFPPAASVAVTFGPGLPSAEGPLTTEKPQEFGFETHGPLTVVRYQCGWDNNCPPLMPWNIEFSNALDAGAFDASQVSITPDLPNTVIQVFGNTLQIQGRSQGRTKYSVRLSGTIRDIYEQTLGEDQTVVFEVGDADPAIWAAGTPFVVLDPALPPRFSVFTINFSRLDVKAYAVTPEDWQAFQIHLRSYYRDEKPTTPPGRLVYSKKVEVKSQPDQLTETTIDLSPALTGDKGQLVLIITPETTGLARLLEIFGGRPPVITTWVQATQIGLDAFVDNTEMIAWANALTDGAPLPGVTFDLLNVNGNSQNINARSGDDGTARITLPASTATTLVARLGDDVAMLPANTYMWDENGWVQHPVRDQLRWHVFDDRGMYRPGEEVHVKGWIRRIGGGEDGDVGALRGAVESVNYRVIDSQGNQVGQGSADLSPLGGFDLAFELPEGINLGYTTLDLTAVGSLTNLDGGNYGHSFQVQEFRRPEFEVVTSASEGPHFIGDSATLEVSAAYYAGGPLPNAQAIWEVRSSAGQYSPPGWDDFTFGRWIPWWRDYGPSFPTVENTQVFEGRTDAAGIHRLQINFESVEPPGPSAVTAQATVMDVNRQAWTSQTNLLVHPASLYVGLRSDRMFVEREEPLPIEAIVTDLDGRPVTGVEITMRASRMEWRYVNDEWREEALAPQNCIIESAAQPVRCTFETPEGGTYRITAEVTDPEGRRNQTQFDRWVSGGDAPPSRRLEQEEAVLIPDREDYQPGDVAEILVQSPFTPAEGVLTLRRSGILSEQPFTMNEATTILRIPIEEAHIPNLYVQVDLVGSAPRLNANGEADASLPPRPAFASGQLNLSVPPLSRTLAVTAAPRDEKLEPGGETSVDVTVLDAAGRPQDGAEVTVIVVDEAILALSSYQLPDPIATFYSERGPDASDYRLRAYTILGQAEIPTDMGQGRGGGPAADMAAVEEAAAMPAPMATMNVEKEAMAPPAEDGAAPPIALRTNFNPLAVFAPEVITDAAGKATVVVKLPDNLTRYRVMVTAVADAKYFGKGESAITARLPLMVRPSPPRFLNFGDRFELPVVLQNQTDEPLTVDVAVRATNVVLTGAEGLRVDVPANDRVEVRFPAAAGQAGTARFQAAAASGEWSDAAEFNLPVWTPATTEAFATYGVLDSGAVAQPVIAPTDVFTQFGALEITTSSTALQELTDAVIYLANYPFECSEQLASRVLSIASLRDVLSAFSAEGLPSEAELNAAVARDIVRLSAMQNDDGGFGIWRRGEESWPYHSVHATNALQRAKTKGYEVSPDTLARALTFIQEIERHIPADYSVEARRAIIAYALNVRWQMNDADPARARALMDEAGLDELSPEAIGWILPVLSDDPESQPQVLEIRRHLNNRAVETAGAAHFVSSYGDNDYVLLHSDRRDDGILLDAMIIDQPASDLIPKLVRGLLSGRTAGRWANTQENVFILMALDRYFNTYESVTPDFVARMWLGETYVGQTEFQGRSTDYRQVDVPMSVLVETTGPQNLTLSKDGAGRLYYRLGLQYAPRDLNLPPADYGFTVERTYEAVDDPADVRRDATGTWFIKAGAKVKIQLTMVAPSRRYHVALVDPLPAGFEPLNPDLAVTGDLPENLDVSPTPYGWWWWGPWYDHQNLRDERAEAFTSLLWDGVYTYTYYARATTPGQFFAPPAKAEEMYAPETFGRSATDRVIVQ